jgi:putative ABC transport system ATP-binding protein
VLQAKNITKHYETASGKLEVLKDVSFEIKAGESVSIVGPSGSGKSTLLAISAGLDDATSGEIKINNNLINGLNQNEKSKIRLEYLGFIFQNFKLIPTLTAIENVMVPLELKGDKNARKTAQMQLDVVGLGSRLDHYPKQLSGGEQQRVAIARAFVHRPKLLFADEPTGNLDNETGELIENLLFEMNKIHQTTLVIVTHDVELAAKTDRLIKLKNGRVEIDVLNSKQ